VYAVLTHWMLSGRAPLTGLTSGVTPVVPRTCHTSRASSAKLISERCCVTT
jgi:hypothetical protein